MKNIKNYDAPKYIQENYMKIEEGIYRTMEKNSFGYTELEDKSIAKILKKQTDWEKNEWNEETLIWQGKSYMKDEESHTGFLVEMDKRELYVTTLSFEQEFNLGEGKDAGNISQYPLEDICDKFCCFISDFYKKENIAGQPVCLQEFCSTDLKDIQDLRSIIGKHVYNIEKDGYIDLVIE